MLAVEPNAGTSSDLYDAERIPLAKGLVGEFQRIFAACSGRIVPQAAATQVRTELEFAFFRAVPDLNLWRATQVDATIGTSDRLVLQSQLDVAVFFVCRQEYTMAVVHDDAILDGPVRGHILVPGFFLGCGCAFPLVRV